MATVQEVWGFHSYLAVEPEGSDLGKRFIIAMNAAAASRGIAPNVPSDALDLSRDIIMDEAAQAVGASWFLAHEGTLRIWPQGTMVDWENVERQAAS